MRGLLENQNVFITAASRPIGVGAGVLEAVLEAGGRPIVNGRSEARLQAVVDRYPDQGVVPVRGDVSSAEDCQRMMEEAIKEVGTIHHLVNNAGVGLHKPPHLVDEAEYDRLFEVDVKACWRLARVWLRHRLDANGELRDQAPASLVNISSVHAERTVADFALYAAAKGAVEAMTRGMAVHYGPAEVRVNCVAPGLVRSDQNNDVFERDGADPNELSQRVVNDYQALNRSIREVEVGRVVVFLLSSMASAVTGQTITVDSGGARLLFARGFLGT